MEAKSLLIGGLLPAFLFGIAGILQKLTQRAGASVGPYLLCAGVGVLAAGTLLTFGSQNRAITGRAALLAATMGLVWATATWLVALAISRYAAPLAKLVPLYNMNTLVVAILALVLFAEHRDVVVTRLLLGAGFIVAGGALVASS